MIRFDYRIASAVYYDCTGRNGLAGCRYGYADVDAFGAGFVTRDTWSGNLDAPDFVPQGSMRAMGTVRHSPRLSFANRDRLTGHAKPGTLHDD